MPLDWQTLVVTIVALGAALVIVRRFVPARRSATPGRPAAPAACDGCEAGSTSGSAAYTPNEASSRTRTTPVVSVTDLRASARRRR